MILTWIVVPYSPLQPVGGLLLFLDFLPHPEAPASEDSGDQYGVQIRHSLPGGQQ